MLKFENITKVYKTGDIETHALKGINIEFRKNEFVSILGPSGCGKTTMLNIIGGLDRYTSGDLIINGKSTKDFKDKDWDSYRNHSIGFVFQSYNLISHQSVLENVELALTLSGVGKVERRKRAIEVLKKVGLEDKINNRPNQLSGGQMQRVAIARALVNDPEIILADEPTGALDTTSSLHVMELLKEISKDKLIIMVTHNPELAEEYSSRIVKILDGNITADSNPYNPDPSEKPEKHLLSLTDDSELSKRELTKKKKKNKMSFFTALSLSFKNLLTKKTRTILTAFAGSIGIIGIAVVLAISNGFNTYVNRVQESTLSSYPVQLTSTNFDMGAIMKIFTGKSESSQGQSDKVTPDDELIKMLNQFNSSQTKNDLKSFKTYIETPEKAKELKKYTSAVQYIYNSNVNAYYESPSNGLVSANPITIFKDVIDAYPKTNLTDYVKMAKYEVLNKYVFGSGDGTMTHGLYSSAFWSEMLDSPELLKNQYELVGGTASHWATEHDEIMIVVDKNNKISDYTLLGLGLVDNQKATIEKLLEDYLNSKNNEPLNVSFTFDDLLNLKYKILLDSDYFIKQADGTYIDIRSYRKTDTKINYNGEDKTYNEIVKSLYDDANTGINIKVAGIIKEKESASSHSISTNIAYTSKLTREIIARINASDVFTEQKAKFESDGTSIITSGTITVGADLTKINDLGETEYGKLLKNMGVCDLSTPDGIYLYPIDFTGKNKIGTFIEDYNKSQPEDKKITYSDTMGLMMSSISTIISSITYVLIAFVGISLIVSSIMIGIITYISVIERTKEIGILRSVGASKKDVKHVFTAESFIIGLSSGLLGIIVTLLITIPVNIVLKGLTGISGIAALPVLSAFILISISIGLTLLAGLIPARLAAKKDPVVALRTE